MHRLKPTTFALAALVLLPLVVAACAMATAAPLAPTTGLATPVPPGAVATLPPARPPRPASAAGGPEVSIANFNFTPANLTVPVGTTVVWTNNDDVEHTITTSNSAISSPAVPSDGEFSFTFTEPGIYSYFCAIHPFMTAKVTVQ